MLGSLASAWLLPERVDKWLGVPDAQPRTRDDAGADAAKPALVKPAVDKAVLLANGHVLMPAKDVIYDWDPFAPEPLRSKSLGDAGPAHTSAFAPTGGRRFIVAKTDEQDNVRFELWDAERLVLLEELGTYVAEDPVVDFSHDGKRVMLLACAVPRGGRRACDAGVYDLATGALVHRTHLPPFPVTGRSRVAGRISPAGSYFALSGEEFATVAYDAESGRLAFRAGDPLEADIDDEILHFAFVDDRRLLTVSARAGLRLTELATGQSKTRRLDSVAGAESLRTLVGPDRASVATELTRMDGTFGVTLFVFEDGSGRDVRVPRPVCPQFCTMRWSGPREVVLHPNDDGAEHQLRVDVDTGRAVVEPYREPPPFEVFGVHPVHGDFDRFGTTKWHPEDRSARYPKGALVTPKGVRFDLATIDIDRVLTSAVADRFLLDALDGLHLLASDGTSAVLPQAPQQTPDIDR